MVRSSRQSQPRLLWLPQELARDAGQVCAQLDEWPATAAAAGRSDTAAVAAALWLADTADALPFVLACEALAAADVLSDKLVSLHTMRACLCAHAHAPTHTLIFAPVSVF